MTSGITPITTASGKSADTSAAGEHQPPGHGLSVLRGIEARALISLGTEALGEAGKLGAELYGLIYHKNARIRDHRLADKLAEMVACVQTAEHYLLMLGSVVGESPRRTSADNPRR
jgi:hypothetical protein